MLWNANAPAKVNLWLEVIRKRSDGYHDLSSLMLPVGIYDRLRVEVEPGEGIGLECSHPHVPRDARNLAWRAAQSYLDKAGVRSRVRIGLAKEIPVGAGLGGGSSDAAAVLLILNRAFEERLSNSTLHELALSLGADVPFFLDQRPALATGVGEKLEPVDGLPQYAFLLIKPPVGVRTAWVYGNLKLTRGHSTITLARFLADPWRLREVMENDLESVTVGAHPLLAEIKEWLMAQGALGALMSGSGPTVFGVFSSLDGAQAVGVEARRRWQDCWVAPAEVHVGRVAGQS